MSETRPAGHYPWPAASATGTGPMPGAGAAETLRLIFGELPELPFLPGLPARGPGADPVGRTAALLLDLPVEVIPGGWRFAARAGRDLSRARGILSADLDDLEEAADGYQGPLKIAVTGPWTLAASIELARSQDPALADPGAVADLTESLAEGLRAHAEQVRKRVPGASLVLQVDEPALPAVAAGTVPTASGLNRIVAPDQPALEAGLRSVLSHVPAFTLVRCDRPPVPFDIIMGSGAGGAGFDLSLLRRGDEDGLAAAVEAGLGVFAGVVPVTAAQDRTRAQATGAQATGAQVQGGVQGQGAQARGVPARGAGAAGPPPARTAAQRVMTLWHRMGWPSHRHDGAAAGPGGVTRQVVLTPAGGLADASPSDARAVLASCREAARLLPEMIEEGSP